MKRTICLMALIVLVIGLLSGCGDTKASPAADFAYTIKDGEVYITGYKGTDREIVIPDEIEERPVTSIARYAFKGYDMTSVVVPSSIRKIETGAFMECKCLESISIPKGVVEIGDFSFLNCVKLNKVEIAGSVEYIGKGAFSGCTSLENLNMPSRIDEVEEGAFAYCKSLFKKQYRLVEVVTESSIYGVSKKIYQYNNKGEISRSVESDEEGTDVFEYVYQYDDAGRVSLEKTITENGELIREKSWGYNDSGIYHYELSWPFLNQTYTYVYNKMDDLTSEHAFENGCLLYRILYEYGELGLESVKMVPEDSDYAAWYRDCECDQYGRVIKMKEVSGDYYVEGEELDGIVTYEYDANGNLIKEVHIELSANGVETRRTEYSYKYEPVK